MSHVITPSSQQLDGLQKGLSLPQEDKQLLQVFTNDARSSGEQKSTC